MVYVVERYLPGLSRSDLLRGLARLERAGEVRYLGSTIVLEDEACFCQFDGPSEAAVARANRQAGLPFDRIVPAVTVESPERRGPMQVSTPIPAPVQIGRARTFGLVVAVAAVLGVGSWAIVNYAAGSGGRTVTASPARPYVVAIPSMNLTRVQTSVQAIVSLTPVQLVEAFGTDVQAAAALASLTPQERLHVEELMALTPAQLRAAFGTSTPADAVQSVVSLTPVQLIEAFGTDYRAAAALASLTPQERLHVEEIMALTPAQLRAAYGTGR